MGKIVAISGGDLESTDSLNRFAIELTEKENPTVLFIPTASHDANGYIENISNYYRKYNCKVDSLCLYTNNYSSKEIENKFQNADLIYVGGGDTENMIKKWKEFFIDDFILRAYENGKVISGISAGAIFWFKYGHSDSEYFTNPDNWRYKFVEGLGVFNAVFCPHYNEEGRNSFDNMLRDIKEVGFALENDTAFVALDELKYIKKANNNAHAYRIVYKENAIEKIELQENVNIEIE